MRDVVIVGAGTAAHEAILALSRLGEGLRITVVAPAERRAAIKSLVATERFGNAHISGTTTGLLANAEDRFLRETVVGVDIKERIVHTKAGSEIAYDDLILAPGARLRPAYQHTTTIGVDPEALAGFLADIEDGYCRSVVFVVPSGTHWPMPIYELALAVARRAWGACSDNTELTIVSGEPGPLAQLGETASALVATRLQNACIRFIGSAQPQVHRGRVTLDPDGDDLLAQRVISLPLFEGRDLTGVPVNDDGLIPIDHHARVIRAPGVYAAGAATNLAIVHPCLACETAAVAAAGIAGSDRANTTPTRLPDVFRGRVLKEGPSLWWPPTTAAGHNLASTHHGQKDTPAGVDVEVPVWQPSSQ